MKAQLSLHKIRNIFVGYFRGLSQVKIAAKVGVDQTSVSHYVARFEEMAAAYGILAAAEEFGVLNEVEALRNLSTELYKSKMTTEEARQGHQIAKAFSKLGVEPEKHLELASVCKKLDSPGFIDAAIELCQIEMERGSNPHQAISDFKTSLKNIQQVYKQLNSYKAELQTLNDTINIRQKQLAALDKQLEQHQIDVNIEAAKMDHELSIKMQKMEIKQIQVDESVSLRKLINDCGSDVATLSKLAEEFSKDKDGIDFQVLIPAAKKFTSLKKENVILAEENKHLKSRYDKYVGENPYLLSNNLALRLINGHLEEQREKLKSELIEYEKKVKSGKEQYVLFESFIAMLLATGTIGSVQRIIDFLKRLLEPGWTLYKNKDELRDIFMSRLMGDLIKSFRCNKCGNKFLTDKDPQGYSYFECPACHSSSNIEADDSLLKAIVSEDKIAKINLLEDTIAENKKLEAIKIFLKVPCDICAKPTTDWTDNNVSLLVKGKGVAHNECWETNAGKSKISSTNKKEIQEPPKILALPGPKS